VVLYAVTVIFKRMSAF